MHGETHVKIGVMKNFVKAMEHVGKAFQYLQLKFPQISESKIKEAIFVGPRIRNLMKDRNIDALLKGTKLSACEVFKVLTVFFVKH
jgi:hypothetical protein